MDSWHSSYPNQIRSLVWTATTIACREHQKLHTHTHTHTHTHRGFAMMLRFPHRCVSWERGATRSHVVVECAPWLSVWLLKQPEDTVGQIWAKRMRFKAAVSKTFLESLAPWCFNNVMHYLSMIFLINKMLLACANNDVEGQFSHYLCSICR